MALIVDPDTTIRSELKPDVEIDAIIAKKNLGTRITDAGLVIGLGIGFEAGKYVHIVIETPTKLTDRQEELLREFAEIENKNVSPKAKSFFEKLKRNGSNR